MAAGTITLEWVEVGGSAFGLVHDGRVVALVYWRDADVAELAGAEREPVVVEAGFSWMPVDAPWDHFYLFAARESSPYAWERARREAARACLVRALQRHPGVTRAGAGGTGSGRAPRRGAASGPGRRPRRR